MVMVVLHLATARFSGWSMSEWHIVSLFGIWRAGAWGGWCVGAECFECACPCALLVGWGCVVRAGGDLCRCVRVCLLRASGLCVRVVWVPDLGLAFRARPV